MIDDLYQQAWTVWLRLDPASRRAQRLKSALHDGDTLAIRAEIALKGFDPHEARDAHGRWTDTGGGMGPEELAQTAFKRQKLSPKEDAALTVYAGLHNFDRINAVLRSGQPLSGEKTVVSGVDSAIEKSVTKQDLVLWRGIDGKLKAKPGDTVSDMAFQSTSLDREVASDFSTDSGTIMELRLPAGSHALSVDQGSDYAGENEVILPRGSTFTVRKVTRGHIVLEATNV